MKIVQRHWFLEISRRESEEDVIILQNICFTLGADGRDSRAALCW
jgi:hypothetical protein